jgi:hypothetical protein
MSSRGTKPTEVPAQFEAEALGAEERIAVSARLRLETAEKIDRSPLFSRENWSDDLRARG